MRDCQGSACSYGSGTTWEGGKGRKYLLKAADLTKLNQKKKVIKVLDNLDVFIKARKADLKDVQKLLKDSWDYLMDGGGYAVKYATPDGMVYWVRTSDDFRVHINLMDEAGDTFQETLRAGKRVGDGGGLAEDAIKGGGSTKNTGKLMYDADGNYTGGRTKAELDALADDPAHMGSKRQVDIEKGIHEQKVGLGVEESGKIKGPITRDPSGKAEFFDADGQAWDVKSFNSYYKPKQGGFTLQSAMRSINKSLSEGEHVILDTTNLSSQHLSELLVELEKQNLMDKIILWP